MLAFLQCIDPCFCVRHDESPEGSYRWMHVSHQANPYMYLALQEANPAWDNPQQQNPYSGFGINHLCFVLTEDIDVVAERLEAAGYRNGIAGERLPQRKRLYCWVDFPAPATDDGSEPEVLASFEIEIVNYTTDDPAKRNEYP